ncbi:MAG: transketolase, partial [Christensenellaceae bacterium]|nr:transketolase [Christensenellaceae bacterium]
MNRDQLSINTVRMLAVDMIQKANSGHPGLPLGASPMVYTLWAKQMKHNPANPDWKNRDRFILSAGHGSAMLYALLHTFGYGLTMDDLKQFRQWGSLTPGHPEYRHTCGVEATTGPLGQGIAMAVGYAMAEAHLAAEFNKPGYNVVDHYTFAMCGDGCLQEGASAEASSLAGHLGLGKLIVLYDKNYITIEGSTEDAFTEDVKMRYEAYGWQVLEVADGNNDLAAIEKAIEEAKAETNKPSMIIIRTEIGYASPLEGSEKSHGAPLGDENIAKTREKLGFDYPAFTVPEEVKAYMAELGEGFAKAEAEWNEMMQRYAQEYPEDMARYESYYQPISEDIFDDAMYTFD